MYPNLDTKTYWETDNKTAISFMLPDTPGILMKALHVFTKNNLNLTRI
jgi:prephenate dehydratase